MPPFSQAPSEAEPAGDLIDMGPEPAATSNLSSQLAGMSEYGVMAARPWEVTGMCIPCHPMGALQQNICRMPSGQVQLTLTLGTEVGLSPCCPPRAEPILNGLLQQYSAF